MGAKILIADDESDIVSMLGSFFESKGFRVLPASNGAEALKQVEKQPDIILLDINMPGKDGLEVCKRIRDHISCPILFLTARIEDTDKVKGFTVGGDDYIVKPFSLMELEARVRAHLRREARHNFEAQVKFSGDLTIDYSESYKSGKIKGKYTYTMPTLIGTSKVVKKINKALKAGYTCLLYTSPSPRD